MINAFPKYIPKVEGSLVPKGNVSIQSLINMKYTGIGKKLRAIVGLSPGAYDLSCVC
jgi:hypothetical protein